MAGGVLGAVVLGTGAAVVEAGAAVVVVVNWVELGVAVVAAVTAGQWHTCLQVKYTTLNRGWQLQSRHRCKTKTR